MLANLIENIGHGFGNISGAFKAGYQKASNTWSDLESIWSSISGSTSSVNRKRKPAIQLREYRSWIYVILTTIYGRTSTVPWNVKVKRPDGTTDLLKNQFVHPLYKLLTEPNPFMTGTFLQQYVQVSLDLTGMAFILKLKNGLGRPAELWPLNVAEFVDFIPGDTTKDFIKGYRFTNVDFPRDDIIYLFYPNPNPTFFSSTQASHRVSRIFGSLTGMSPIQAMATIVDTEKYIEIFERDFFENSARPDVILTTNDGRKFDPKERQRILTQWKQKHQGPKRFWEPTVLTGMTAEILKSSNRDFQFFKLAEWTKNMLFAAYSVPEAKVGLVKDVNRANQVGVEITFNEECIMPRLNLWDESFTNQLAQEFDEKLLIEHDNPVPSDKEFELKKDESDIKNLISSINEVRSRRGEDKVFWGDAPWIPFSLVQPSKGTTTEQPKPEPPAKPEEEEGEEGKSLNEHITKNKFLPTDEAKDAYWKVFDGRVREHELIFIRMLRKLFKSQRKEVLDNLDKMASEIEAQFAGWSKRKIARYIKQDTRIINNILFDQKKAIKDFEGAANPVIAEAFEESGQALLTDLGLDISFDLQRRRATKFIGEKVKKFAKEVNETTLKELRATLREGFAEGESISQLTSRVKKVYDKADSSRAVMTARTEILASSNAGSLEGMQQSGVIDEKEWLSSRDDRVRDSHIPPLDGQTVKITEDFTSNDGNQAQHPGGFGVAEEDINCRCTVIAVVK